VAQVILQHVTKRFGNVIAVNDATLEVRDREFMVLVGPSGCGKSTTLRMVAGLEDVTEGNIYIGETLVNNIPPKDRDIAMVFQNYALYPHMDVYNNMAFGLKLRKFPRAEIDRRVREHARLLGIENLLDRKPTQLSGGQKQRVAVGRAIVREPKVFLMDEPLSNLDALLRVQMRAELSKIHARLQTTAIYVTHDQTEAMTMGDRICVLKDGVIQQVGPPLEIYDHPVNVFVAGFIGNPPMNFVNGFLKKEGDNYIFDANGAFRVTIHPDRARQIKNIGAYVDKEVILGIRPEDIDDAKIHPGDESNTVIAMVDVVEPMGAESLIYLSKGEAQLVAKVDPHSDAEDGVEHPVRLNMKKVHIFDKDTEQVVV